MKPQQVTTQMFINDTPMEFGRVLCIDPGLGGTGLAFWNELSKGMNPADPDLCVLHHFPDSYGWLARVKSLTDNVVTSMKQTKPDWVVIEFPKLWGSSEKSFTSAARGDLFKLTYLVGNIGREVVAATFRPPVLVTPKEWKGQMSKDVVHRRIKRALNISYGEHVADAVGMGLAIMGAL